MAGLSAGVGGPAGRHEDVLLFERVRADLVYLARRLMHTDLAALFRRVAAALRH